MRIVTGDDLIDIYTKGKQRGWQFIVSKLHLNHLKRTKSAFNDAHIKTANWWEVPAVKQRWNQLISGHPGLEYKAYLMDKYFAKSKNLKLLSIGSGSCSHELKLATYPQFEKIICLDIAEKPFIAAKEKAKEKNFGNIDFQVADFYQQDLGKEVYDLILFHSSLHHFNQVNKLLQHKIKTALKPGGKLLINEYVGPNRLQLPREQIKAINHALKQIPQKYRKRYRTNLYKNRFSGSGWCRMYIADPSECVDSAAILPSLHQHYQVIEEKPYGGNLLMHVLKDIAHHFAGPSPEKTAILDHLFELEDHYLKSHPSDFIMGFYENKGG